MYVHIMWGLGCEVDGCSVKFCSHFLWKIIILTNWLSDEMVYSLLFSRTTSTSSCPVYQSPWSGITPLRTPPWALGLCCSTHKCRASSLLRNSRLNAKSVYKSFWLENWFQFSPTGSLFIYVVYNRPYVVPYAVHLNRDKAQFGVQPLRLLKLKHKAVWSEAVCLWYIEC